MTTFPYLYGIGANVDIEPIFGRSLDQLLETCAKQSRTGLVMPQLVILSESWREVQGMSLSQVIRGKRSDGLMFDVYSHVPGMMTDLEYFQDNICKLTSDGSMPLPQQEFDRLLSIADDKQVFLTNPETTLDRRMVAFYGGNAQVAIIQHRDNAGINPNMPGFNESGEPRGKLLFLGNSNLMYDGTHDLAYPKHMIYGVKRK